MAPPSESESAPATAATADAFAARASPQWMYPLDAFVSCPDPPAASSPNILTGLSPALVTDAVAARLSACSFIEKVAGRFRNLPTETVAVAKMFLLRFSMRRVVSRSNPSTGIHPYVAGGTALFLSCKSTDNYRKLSNIIYHCRWVAFKGPEGVKPEVLERPELKESDKEYQRWYENIISAEEEMTSALCFDLVVALPHEISIDLLKMTFGG
ncbi:hypothetical protein HDU84_006468 [Entophlyctis sp. JEL0112]|nr:hypothetical protein HDU84_006468 [Entophlyctis sp. JEL0112]